MCHLGFDETEVILVPSIENTKHYPLWKIETSDAHMTFYFLFYLIEHDSFNLMSSFGLILKRESCFSNESQILKKQHKIGNLMTLSQDWALSKA